MAKLTPKQEKFVQGIVAGLSQRKAYKQAYNCERMKETTIDEQASKLFSNHKIAARYNELIKEHQKKALWTRERAVQELIWLVDTSRADIEINGVRQANSNAFLGGVKELNELEFKLPDSIQRTAAEIEKKSAETEHIKEKTKLLKGASKDTSLLEALIDVVKSDD
jgi:hypothetical protein